MINPHGPGSLKDGHDKKYIHVVILNRDCEERGAGTLNVAEKCAMSWANNIWISFVCQTKQKHTTILPFYFDRFDPQCCGGEI